MISEHDREETMEFFNKIGEGVGIRAAKRHLAEVAEFHPGALFRFQCRDLRLAENYAWAPRFNPQAFGWQRAMSEQAPQSGYAAHHSIWRPGQPLAGGEIF